MRVLFGTGSISFRIRLKMKDNNEHQSSQKYEHSFDDGNTRKNRVMTSIIRCSIVYEFGCFNVHKSTVSINYVEMS